MLSNQCRSAFGPRKVWKRKRNYHDVPFYKSLHASSSSGLFQSAASEGSLTNVIPSTSSRCWAFRKRTKSITYRIFSSGTSSISFKSCSLLFKMSLTIGKCYKATKMRGWMLFDRNIISFLTVICKMSIIDLIITANHAHHTYHSPSSPTKAFFKILCRKATAFCRLSFKVFSNWSITERRDSISCTIWSCYFFEQSDIG